MRGHWLGVEFMAGMQAFYTLRAQAKARLAGWESHPRPGTILPRVCRWMEDLGWEDTGEFEVKDHTLGKQLSRLGSNRKHEMQLRLRVITQAKSLSQNGCGLSMSHGPP